MRVASFISSPFILCTRTCEWVWVRVQVCVFVRVCRVLLFVWVRGMYVYVCADHVTLPDLAGVLAEVRGVDASGLGTEDNPVLQCELHVGDTCV